MQGLWRNLRSLLHRRRHQGRHQPSALSQVWEWEYEESNNLGSHSIAKLPMKNKQRFLFLTFLISMMMNVNAQNQNSSSQLINTGSELLRINTAKNSIEYSSNGGRSWVTRCSNVAKSSPAPARGCMSLETTGNLSRPDAQTPPTVISSP